MTSATPDPLRWDRAAGPSPGGSLARGFRPRRGLTAFMLSGGGARGALHVGALRALMEHGIYPDIVIGASVGAWNATAVARTPTLAGVRGLGALWREAHAARVLLGRVRPAGSPLSLNLALLWDALRRTRGGSPSLCANTGLRSLLTTHLGDATFDEMALPLLVTATDLTTGERAVLRSGRLIPALLASSAIPGIFPPVRIGDRLYADGGALDSASFDAAIALGAQRIVVLALGYDLDGDGARCWGAGRSRTAAGSDRATPRERDALPSVAAVIERSTQVRHRVELNQALLHLPAEIETHIIPLSAGTSAGALDFTRVPDWITRGHTLTREYLARTATLRQQATVAQATVAAERSGEYRVAHRISA